jgi:hypothetical protein
MQDSSNFEILTTMSDAQTLRGVRLMILVAISAALIVTEAELLFAGHAGSNNGQEIAVVLVGLGLITVTCPAILRNTSSIVVFRFTMYLFLIFSIDGFLTHYHWAVQAALKSQPTLVGMPLLYATLSGKIPLLAPRMLIEIGLLGLIHTFQHSLDIRFVRRIEALG